MSAVLDRNGGWAIIDHYVSPEDRLAVKEKVEGKCLKFTLHVFSGANKKMSWSMLLIAKRKLLVVDGDVTLVLK